MILLRQGYGGQVRKNVNQKTKKATLIRVHLSWRSFNEDRFVLIRGYKKRRKDEKKHEENYPDLHNYRFNLG